VAIKNLEEELDVKLSERGGSEDGVTPPGDEIVRQARAVVEQARRSRRSPSAARTRSRAHCGWPQVRALRQRRRRAGSCLPDPAPSRATRPSRRCATASTPASCRAWRGWAP